MKQNHEIRIKMTKEEHDRIKLKSKKMFMTMAQFMKSMALAANLEISTNTP